MCSSCLLRPCWGSGLAGDPSVLDGQVELYECCPGASCICCLFCCFPFVLMDACALIPRSICDYKQVDSIDDVCSKNVFAGCFWLICCCNFQFKTYGMILDNRWETGSRFMGVFSLTWVTYLFWCGNPCFISNPEG
jgi:hypothetical protein